MSAKKHDAVFDDVLSGLDRADDAADRAPSQGGARFLKRSNALGERAAGTREEKLLHWVDPAECRMWDRHNRDYSLLSEANCRDLIDGIQAQGRQEFPAVVRRLSGEDHAFEVICGARRHFAVSWLRANNYPQFRYLVEVRDLTDEEAFRLADIENREREDISDFERARDYLQAIGLYYGGKQKSMAARLEVSEAWLSRYLALARLPDDVVAAFPSLRDIRELHARTLKPLLADPARFDAIVTEARSLATVQTKARTAGTEPVSVSSVLSRLQAAGAPPKARATRTDRTFGPIRSRRMARKIVLDVPDGLTRADAKAALMAFLDAEFGPE